MESRLNQSISNNEISIVGHKIATCDPNDSRKGGGSIIYFVEHLKAYERSDINSDYSLEAAWIDNKSFLSKFSSTVDRF